MTADVFVDTNVFLYAIADDADSASKRDRSRALLLTERWGWSVQIASEFSSTRHRRGDRFGSPPRTPRHSSKRGWPTRQPK